MYFLVFIQEEESQNRGGWKGPQESVKSNSPDKMTGLCQNKMIAFLFTESQNRWGWKKTLEIIWSNPVLKNGHLEQVAQDHVQAAFEDLRGRRLHSLSLQSMPVLSHSQWQTVS